MRFMVALKLEDISDSVITSEYVDYLCQEAFLQSESMSDQL